MSIHAMIAAAYLENLDPSTRLVLMAVADSSDEHTRESAPGLPKLRAWSGLGKSQTLRRVRDLEEAGLLEQMTRAYRGRRAVWRVFPAGVPPIPHPDEVAARYADDDSPQVVPNVENPGSCPQDDTGKGRADATQSPLMGRIEGPNGSRPRDPFITTLQSSSDDSANPPARRVDNRTAPPPVSTGSGFPGTRTTAPVDLDTRRRAPGANNRPCPVGDHARHGEIHGGCGRCAHAAANTDQAAGAKAARAALRPRPTTTTEESPNG